VTRAPTSSIPFHLMGQAVLHVDTDPAARRQVSDILEEEGIEVVEAFDGLEALQMLRDREIDLLMTDLKIPAMDGLSLIERVKQWWPDLPIVVVAGESTTEDVLSALGGGAVIAYITKPFTERQLRLVVKETLETAQREAGMQVVSATPSWIELRIPNRSMYISRVREFLENLEMGIARAERDNLLYAMTELAQNAIEHGNQHNPNTRVTMAFYRFPGLRVFRVHDEGLGFDPTNLDHAVGFRRDVDPRDVLRRRKAMGIRPGGLGIATAVRYADELLYNEKGNEVILVKLVAEAEGV
jgi:CheY-like chemotaxis protein